jgi:GNAT superfamily N-acetyltransferase
MSGVTYRRDGAEISDDRDRLDLVFVHRFLCEESYWAQGRSWETMERAVRNSLCLGVYVVGAERASGTDDRDGQGCAERQVGFARVVTDYATFAWLCDVFIATTHRGQGLGKWLVSCVVAHPTLQGVKTILLATRDAHELYGRYGGFQPMEDASPWMLARPLASSEQAACDRAMEEERDSR